MSKLGNSDLQDDWAGSRRVRDGRLRSDLGEAFADLVLFDQETVQDAATFGEPMKVSVGILEAWMNEESTHVYGKGATEARTGR